MTEINISIDLEEALSRTSAADSLEKLKLIKNEFLGKDGIITQAIKNAVLSTEAALSADAKNRLLISLNETKSIIQKSIKDKQIYIDELLLANIEPNCDLDLSLQAYDVPRSTLHPITKTIMDVRRIFGSMGFKCVDGQEIESVYYNFDALNSSKYHPARRKTDTLYLDNETLLRTHTTPVQARLLKELTPPFHIISTGRVYRADSCDQTHTPMFHQVDGFVISDNANISTLKSCLERFLREFFETDSLFIRFRPGFFPFTEPSLEVDVNYSKIDGRLVVGEGSDWVEILGSGIIHKNVLKMANVDTSLVGFAFGIGIERITMLKYGISDIRAFYENDINWTNTFGSSPFVD